MAVHVFLVHNLYKWFYAFEVFSQAGPVLNPYLLLNLVISDSIAYSHLKSIITQYIKYC